MKINTPAIIFVIFVAMLLTSIIPVHAEEIASAASAKSINFSEPFITIDPIGNHTVGEVFFINGTTNLTFLNEHDFQLIITPVGSYFRARGGTLYNPEVLSYSNGTTRWSFKVTDFRWDTDEYVACAVSSSFPYIYDTQLFWVFPTVQTNTTQQHIQSESLVRTSPSNQISNPITVTSRQETKATPSRASPVTELVLIVAFITGIIIFGNRRC